LRLPRRYLELRARRRRPFGADTARSQRGPSGANAESSETEEKLMVRKLLVRTLTSLALEAVQDPVKAAKK